MRWMIRQDPISVSGFKASGGVASRANCSAAVRNSTEPYVVRPRRAKALRFQIGQRTVFAAQVNRPRLRPPVPGERRPRGICADGGHVRPGVGRRVPAAGDCRASQRVRSSNISVAATWARGNV
jgi:hypothetical protein